MAAFIPTCAYWRGAAWALALVGAWAASSGCDTSPSRPVSAPRQRAPAAAQAGPTRLPRLPASYAVLPTAAQRGYHHYVGSLGGRPVQLDLTVSLEHRWLAADGGRTELTNASFSYLDSSRTLRLAATDFPPRQPLDLSWTSRRSSSGQELLCTDQPVGPLLTGTYVPDREPLAFRLREDYADCLRYEVLEEETAIPDREASLKRSYLHLLGADTLRPARARLQCPPPAQRRQARAAVAKRVEAHEFRNQYLDVSLNEADLFAYTLEERFESTLSRYYDTRTRQCLYDLRTGRPLALFTQLRPGGKRRLRQLLTRQALADTVGAPRRDYWRPAGGAMPFPAAGFIVTSTGLVADYGLSEADPEPDRYLYRQTLTWADLRPLLRPTSPLRRLLKAPAKQRTLTRSR